MRSLPAWAEESRLWTVPEYLGASFSPDCDFVDGAIEARNVGSMSTARCRVVSTGSLAIGREEWNIDVVVETRLQVSPDHFRVPDVMVLRAGEAVHRIVRVAPLICMEVISPEDTWKRLNGVLSDYLAMGVESIWAFDPDERRAYRFDADGLHPVTGGELVVAGTAIRLPLEQVFPDFDGVSRKS